MKKIILFIGTALFVVLVASCTPDEIEQDNSTQKVDIEKRAMDGGGNQYNAGDIPKEK